MPKVGTSLVLSWLCQVSVGSTRYLVQMLIFIASPNNYWECKLSAGKVNDREWAPFAGVFLGFF